MGAASASCFPPGCLPAPLDSYLPGAAALARWSARPAQGVLGHSHLQVLKAALNLAAAHDQRIGNSAVWRHALAGLPNSSTARRVGLPERDVRTIVAAAYAVAPQSGSGPRSPRRPARARQIAGLDVGDLQAGRDDARLIMPSSMKGRGPPTHRTSPDTDPTRLTVKLRQAAAGRPPDAALLTKSGGERWQRAEHVQPFALAAAKPARRRYGLRYAIATSFVPCWPACRRGSPRPSTTPPPRLWNQLCAYILDHTTPSIARALLDLAVQS